MNLASTGTKQPWMQSRIVWTDVLILGWKTVHLLCSRYWTLGTKCNFTDRSWHWHGKTLLDYGQDIPMLPPLGNFVPLYFWNPYSAPNRTRGVSTCGTWKNDVIMAKSRDILKKIVFSRKCLLISPKYVLTAPNWQKNSNRKIWPIWGWPMTS